MNVMAQPTFDEYCWNCILPPTSTSTHQHLNCFPLDPTVARIDTSNMLISRRFPPFSTVPHSGAESEAFINLLKTSLNYVEQVALTLHQVHALVASDILVLKHGASLYYIGFPLSTPGPSRSGRVGPALAAYRHTPYLLSAMQRRVTGPT
jgi:hypothetical protein